MTAVPPLIPGPAPSSGGHPGNGRGDISLSRIYLPFAMVITFGAFLLVAGYTVGSIMSGLARDKAETDARLGAIEKEVTAIKNILADRSLNGPSCPGRGK